MIEIYGVFIAPIPSVWQYWRHGFFFFYRYSVVHVFFFMVLNDAVDVQYNVHITRQIIMVDITAMVDSISNALI